MVGSEHPTRHVPIDGEGAARGAHALELAAPLALGQRGLVVAPPRTGATTVLRWLGQAVDRSRYDAMITCLLVDRPPEELAEWAAALPDARRVATTTTDGPAAHARLAQEIHAAAERADAGADEVLLVDSLSSLVRALVALDDSGDERVLDGGLPVHVLAELRSLVALAGQRAGGGSLTILGTVVAGTATHLDEVVLNELVATGNVEWYLDRSCIEAGLFPPVDLERSGARRAELILGDDVLTDRAHVRSTCTERGLLAGLDLALNAGSATSVAELAAAVRPG